MDVLEHDVFTFNEEEIFKFACIYGVEKQWIKSIKTFETYDIGAVYHIQINRKYFDQRLVKHKSIVIKCSKALSFSRTDLHIQLMALFNKSKIPCPNPIQIVSNNNNKHLFIHSTPNSTTVHCMTYVQGSNASAMKHKNNLFYRRLGNVVGNISKCLKDFDHDAAHWNSAVEYCWDLANTHKAVLPNLKYIENDKHKLNLINYYFSEYNKRLKPNIKYLRHSVIHGDLNDDNILCCNDKIVAVFDFDAHFTCTIFELAICCAYFMWNEENVAKGINNMIQIVCGYNERYPLHLLEIQVLWTTICCRMVISAMEGYKYKLLDPENKFVNSCVTSAWNFLKWYRNCDHVDMVQLIKKHIRMAML